MLRLSATFAQRPILSLRTGQVVGVSGACIINPYNLKIEGWYATSTTDKGIFILPSIEIRDIIPKGIVVNDYDSLTHPDDLVRMQETIGLNFDVIGLRVETESGTKLGKVVDYSLDDGQYFIQKLYVAPTLLRSFSKGELLIDRQQIIEITAQKIIVNDQSSRAVVRSTAPAGA